MKENILDNDLFDSKYGRMYRRLISRRIVNRLSRKTGYCEKHHIIPRCVGGTDTKDNLVLLTAREHYISHLILCKVYRNTKYYDKLLLAVLYMIAPRSSFSFRKNLKFNSRLYEKIRTDYSESKIGWFEKLTDEQKDDFRNKTGRRLLGKKLSDDHRAKISKASTGRKMPQSQRMATSRRMRKAMEPRRRKVICLDTGVVYESILAAEIANPKCKTISRCCRGRNATSGGYRFAFFDEELSSKFTKKLLKPTSSMGEHARKQIFCVELNRSFCSLKECSEELTRLGYKNSKNNNIAPYTIRNVANGKFSSCGGLHFKWGS